MRKTLAQKIVHLSGRKYCQSYFNRLTIRFGSAEFAVNRMLLRAKKPIEMKSSLKIFVSV
jgi:hypothetical protein